ncbi:hypothetical protein CU072_11105 [Bacillus thuringiensis]|nr:hypothetical protein CU072_11105 [Bacillus thuringiensis]
MLILNIRTIINKYINIEKFITKLAINDSKHQSKLLAISLLSNLLKGVPPHIHQLKKTDSPQNEKMSLILKYNCRKVKFLF